MFEIRKLYQLFLASKGVSIDSRTIEKGQIFFGLRGDNFNGNEFIQSALHNGALYVISDDPFNRDIDERVITVDDTLVCLQKLAQYHRSQAERKILAITGSNGKTTTKELVKSIFDILDPGSKQFYTTPGNKNNHIGVPLSILSLNDTHSKVVLELGDNHFGEIELLCNISNPDAGLITNLSPDHVGEFGSMQINIDSKLQLFDFIKNKNGTILFNYDEEILNSYKNIHNISSKFTYSTKGDSKARFVLTKIFEPSIESEKFTILTVLDNQLNKYYNINSPLRGIHNAENILAAISIAHYFEIDFEAIEMGITNYQPKNLRSQIKKIGDVFCYLDCYNANPASMKASLDTISGMGLSDTLCIMGDMYELGEFSKQYHIEIIEYIEKYPSFSIIFIGTEFENALKEIKPTYSYVNYLDVDSSLTDLGLIIKGKKLILLKGSRGLKMERIVDYIQDITS